MRRRTTMALVAMAATAVLVLPGSVAAQDDADPFAFDEATRAAIAELIPDEAPTEEPTDADLAAADAAFAELLAATGIAGDATEATPSGSSSLAGPCGGRAYSYGKSGGLIDAALDPGGDGAPIDLLDGGQAFTSSNPFEVDTEGVVLYFGFMPRAGDGPEDHEWSVDTAGISIDSGGDPNPNRKNNAVGTVNLADDLPFAFNAEVEISGRLDSPTSPSCVGSGTVRFVGPWFSPVGAAAIALFGGGILGLLFTARPAHTF